MTECKRCRHLEKENARLRKRCRQLEKENERLRKKIAKLMEEIEKLTEIIEKLTEIIEKLKECLEAWVVFSRILQSFFKYVAHLFVDWAKRYDAKADAGGLPKVRWVTFKVRAKTLRFAAQNVMDQLMKANQHQPRCGGTGFPSGPYYT